MITCGTVRAKVTVNIEASSSCVRTCCEPDEGVGCAAGAVLNVYVSDWPDVVCVAAVNMPPVFDRFRFKPELDDDADGLTFEGCVMNAKASFSVLNGIVISAPLSSPSVTTVTLPPGYLACSLELAEAISEGLNPDTEVPFPPDINDLGNRNFKPTVTEPSLPNVALVS